MGLNIKNPATEAAIRTLAAKRGISLTMAVDQAVHEILDQERTRDASDLHSLVAMIQAAHRPGDPPLQDPREFLYDPEGLPG